MNITRPKGTVKNLIDTTTIGDHLSGFCISVAGWEWLETRATTSNVRRTWRNERKYFGWEMEIAVR